MINAGTQLEGVCERVKKNLVALRDDNGETGYVAQRYVPQTNEVCAA